MSYYSRPDYCPETGNDRNNPRDRYANVWTDGACTNNGYSDAKAGIGIFWGNQFFDPSPNSGRCNALGPLAREPQTNNRAEYVAALIAIIQARNEGVRVRVHTDSKILVDTMDDWVWRWLRPNGVMKKADGGTPENVDILEELVDIVHTHGKENVEWVHVYGHDSSNYGNKMADRLARKGATVDRMVFGKNINL